jgi:hypothetical protein
MIVFWGIFAVAFLITLYYFLALMYHWLRYGFMYPFVWIAIPVYLVGTGFLLLISLAALNGIS